MQTEGMLHTYVGDLVQMKLVSDELSGFAGVSELVCLDFSSGMLRDTVQLVLYATPSEFIYYTLKNFILEPSTSFHGTRPTLIRTTAFSINQSIRPPCQILPSIIQFLY